MVRPNWCHLQISVLILGVIFSTGTAQETQRFDGWYNNLAHPSWGSVGDRLTAEVFSAYGDYTYKAAGSDRPSARLVSNVVFSGASGQGSLQSKNSMFTFFSQLVIGELIHSGDSTCPVEILHVPVPRCDQDFDPLCKGKEVMPYERVSYDKRTGQSPNNPRKQTNRVSSFIDGSFVYGHGEVWANNLRQHGTGKLAASDKDGLYPELNTIQLPFKMFPNPINHSYKKSETLWKLGDTNVHESPPLLALGLLFFRYHNYLADRFEKENPTWTPNKVFHTTRRWVIATLQNIIVYEWLPNLLNSHLASYKGYKPDVHPGISSLFDAAAIRYVTTLFPPGFYSRNAQCEFSRLENKVAGRLCNCYWMSQDFMNNTGETLENILMGMSSQIAEREDLSIVEDLRSKFYGPLHYSRSDHIVQMIMKGRDYGISDYRTVRRELGLTDISDWHLINPQFAWTAEGAKIINDTKHIYLGDLRKLDLFVGGMLETTPQGPGEVFTKILTDQFVRLRDGDRFWFENTLNGLFEPNEIAAIRQIRLYDVMIAATGLQSGNIQQNVFTWKQGDPCRQPEQLRAERLQPCTPHQGYDYFNGSETSYIIIWICIGLIPFICIGVAYAFAKCRLLIHNSRLKQMHLTHLKQLVRSKGGSVSAAEWIGREDQLRSIELQLKYADCRLDVYTSKGSLLRKISFANRTNVDLTTSSNKGRRTLLINVPKEYDIVIMFGSEQARITFVNNLGQLLKRHSIAYEIQPVTEKGLIKRTITRQKRNEMLEKFFKTVFSEAFQMDYDPTADQKLGEINLGREILECELTKEEFAEALDLKTSSDFVEHMFCIIDSDRNGYISFGEFLHVVVLFSKGTVEDKLQMFFQMYDIDGSGRLDNEELNKMFRSLLDMADSDLPEEDINRLVQAIREENGVANGMELNFEDFYHMLSPQMDQLWNKSIDWKGAKKRMPKKGGRKSQSPASPRMPSTSSQDKSSRRESFASLGGRKQSLGSQHSAGSIGQPAGRGIVGNPTIANHQFVAVREKYSPIKAKMKSLKHYIQNNSQSIFYLVLFYSICIGVFAERFYAYSVLREHSGLRRIMGYGLSVTRGAAAAMSFTFTFLLLTMCRNLITWLRSTFLNLYVPFDAHVTFHKVVAWTALFFTALHVIGYGFNFYSAATEPTKYLCVFETIVFRDEIHPAFTFWVFGNLTGFTGLLLTITLCVIYVFATNLARSFIFNAFWLTHKLFVLLYILTILHGGAVVVQKPMFHAYLIGPAILFTIDKLISLGRKKVEISVVRVDHLQSDVTYLGFKRPAEFEYRSGQWVKIACLAQGRNEYHPFTLTSAPHEETLSVHIRALGPWTWNIRNIFDPENLMDGPYPKLFLDGPYGAGQQDWYQYEVSVLVGAGIGVTPYASILKDFVHMSSINNMYKVKCQKLYFIWVTASQRHFEWLIDIMREVESVDKQGVVTIDIFITQFFQNFDLRTAMLYICEDHFNKLSGGRSVFTGLKATTHFGRPQMDLIMKSIHEAHPQVRKIGVFSCGPPGVTKSVDRACVTAGRTTKALYKHHFENFY